MTVERTEEGALGSAVDANGVALFARVYGELHQLAHRERRALGRDSTLNTTALVHETWLKLRAHARADANASQFFALAARAMRQILVDYARRRRARKRGGDFTWTELSDDIADGAHSLTDVIALDRALDALERVDPELSELVECHIFAGLAMEKVAELRGVAPRTAFRDWRRARAFLLDRMAADSGTE